MIRNVVIHIFNDQPMMADLFAMPTGRDAGLVCTNLRTMTGTRAIFTDRIDSVFFFPYVHIRFVEIPPDAEGTPDVPALSEGQAAPDGGEPAPEAELEIDEDFLRRVREA